MTNAVWQARRSNLQKNSGRYPPWDLLNELAAEPESVSTSEAYEGWHRELQGQWCFRGHREASWFLIPSLYRERQLVQRRGIDVVYETYQPFDARVREDALREKFTQRASEFLPLTANLKDPLPWMQHYYPPTTLLDFTYSPDVALYFAFEDELSEQCDSACAVWAIDLNWLETRSNEMRTKLQSILAVVLPRESNPRLAAQKGLFLQALNQDRTFSECLLAMVVEPPAPDRPVLSKQIVTREHRAVLLDRLRNIGIDKQSMRPGPQALEDVGRTLRDDMRASLKVEADEHQKLLLDRMAARNHR
jgi:hypothetical protein